VTWVQAGSIRVLNLTLSAKAESWTGVSENNAYKPQKADTNGEYQRLVATKKIGPATFAPAQKTD